MKKFLLLCFSLAFAASVWAQERTVSGKVSSTEDGSALPGVNVLLKGTTNGTVTDADGNFRLSGLPASGGSLVFSFIGLQTQEVPIGERTVVDVSLALDVTQLSEVVVTAVGIEREKKALGYSVATVQTDRLQQRSESDPLRALQGKMPGVNIIGAGGTPGQSTKINIRGQSSLTGNTQPLFVVDGIPFDNSVNATGSSVGATNAASSGGTAFSNRAFDIDPNNIESISVLKGAAASALYGSRATNGVVVITTKAARKGTKKGLEVTYNGSYNVEQISGIPDYQDMYTQGSNQVYNGGFIGNWGAPFPNHVDRINSQYGTNYVKYYGTYTAGPQSGQPYPDGTAPHPLVGVPYTAARYQGIFPQYLDANGQPIPYQIQPHDIVGGFFRDGKLIENAVSISGGSDKAAINAGFSRMNNDGMIPNSNATRTTLYFGGNSQLDNGLFISGTVNYANTSQQSPQSQASAFSDYYAGDANFAGAGSIYARLFYLPRNYDLNGLPFENPVTGDNVFYRALDNPLWIAKYNLYTSDVNRVYGNLSLGYDVTDWLNVMAKGGVNTYHEARRNVIRQGGVTIPLGQIWTEDLSNTEVDMNFIATANRDLNEDLNLKVLLGYNVNQRELNRRRVTGNQIISSGLNLTNATATQIVDWDYTRLRRFMGVYGDVSLAYKNYLFLNVVARNDWSSTLPKENNSYLYPGASVSFIFTEAFDLGLSWIDFGKARIAATKVGNDADPYRTATNYFIDTKFTSTTGVISNRASLSNTLGNANLKPEFTTEYEGGLEMRFLKGRVGLDLTYFKRVSTDQIASAALARSSGFSQEIVNIGELENKGWEIGLDVTPVQLANGFTWNMFFAYTRIRSLVVDAGPTGQIFIGGGGSTFGTIHRAGFPYGQIFGTQNDRDANGNLYIDSELGTPFTNSSSTIIGDPNPDFTLGWTNTFTYKGFTLSALIDWRQGGDFYSFTAASLLLRGQLKISEDREGLRIIPGVLYDRAADAPITEGGVGVRNTIPITAFDYHFSDGYGAYGQDEVNIYDGTVIRLREISLGYQIPKSVLSKTPFGSARVSVSGRNLWFNAPNVLEGLNLDPEVLAEAADSNIQGFEYGAAPTTRRFGVNLTLTF